MNKLVYMFIFCGFLGYITLIPGFSNKVQYFYLRLITGSELQDNGICKNIPHGWALGATIQEGQYKRFHLRRNHGDVHQFVSVSLRSGDSIPNIGRFSLVKSAPGEFDIYEVKIGESEEGQMYWSSLKQQPIMLLTDELELLSELSQLPWNEPCD